MLSAEKQIKREALKHLRDNNWGKAIAVTVALLCVLYSPYVMSLPLISSMSTSPGYPHRGRIFLNGCWTG